MATIRGIIARNDDLMDTLSDLDSLVSELEDAVNDVEDELTGIHKDISRFSAARDLQGAANSMLYDSEAFMVSVEDVRNNLDILTGIVGDLASELRRGVV